MGPGVGEADLIQVGEEQVSLALVKSGEVVVAYTSSVITQVSNSCASSAISASSSVVKTRPVGLDGLQSIRALGRCSKARRSSSGSKVYFGGAAGDHQMGLRVQGQAHEPALLGRQGFPEIVGAPGNRILVRSLGGGHGRRLRQVPGRVKVGGTLREVDPSVLVINAGHPADDGVGEVCQAATELRHGGHDT